MTSRYSRVRRIGASHGTPYQPSVTCGPEMPRPSTTRPGNRHSSVAAVIAVVVAWRAGIWRIALPTLIRSVFDASHAINETASAP